MTPTEMEARIGHAGERLGERLPLAAAIVRGIRRMRTTCQVFLSARGNHLVINGYKYNSSGMSDQNVRAPGEINVSLYLQSL